jgi:hypothetical protein
MGTIGVGSAVQPPISGTAVCRVQGAGLAWGHGSSEDEVAFAPRRAEGVRSELVALGTGLKHYLGPFEDYAKVKVEVPGSLQRPGDRARMLALP